MSFDSYLRCKCFQFEKCWIRYLEFEQVFAIVGNENIALSLGKNVLNRRVLEI